MKKTKIYRMIEAKMEAGVNDVLLDDADEFQFGFINPTMIKEYMKSLGYECGELETNGWQYDWWLTFTKGDKSFIASGCGHDGSFSFSKDEY